MKILWLVLQMALSMKAGKCPTDELSTTNFVIASPQDLDDKKCRSLHFAILKTCHLLMLMITWMLNTCMTTVNKCIWKYKLYERSFLIKCLVFISGMWKYTPPHTWSLFFPWKTVIACRKATWVSIWCRYWFWVSSVIH